MIRRYERERPGELIHVDVKKLGRIPDGGGHTTLGRDAGRRIRGMGFDYVHSAVDDHSRLAHSEIHPDEKVTTCADFLTRAAAFFHAHGITRIEGVLTDNAWAYRKGLTSLNPHRSLDLLKPPTTLDNERPDFTLGSRHPRAGARLTGPPLRLPGSPSGPGRLAG